MKNTKYKINSWVITAVVIIAVVLVNIIVTTISSKVPLKIDLTEDKIYELTDDTKKITKELDKDVTAYVLCTQDQADTLVKEYVSRYKQLTNKLHFKYIDIYKNQTMLTKYQQKGENVAQGDIILECKDKYKVISVSTLISNLSSQEDSGMYSFDLEAKLTNGILSVTGKAAENKFYFLTGHGEQKTTNFDSIIKDKDNAVETVSIINAQIPDDADILVTVTPTSDFTEDECAKIDKFLDNGGKLMVLYSPGLEACPRFESYLAEWGITPVHGLVCENDTTKYNQSPVLFYPDLQEHEITNNLISMKIPMLFYGSIGFNVNNNNSQKSTVTSLAKTSTKSVMKSNISSSNPVFEEGDTQGPIDVCVLSEKDVTAADGTKKKATIFAMGSANAFEITEKQTGNKANSEFTENAVSYLTSSSSALKISSKIITEGLFTAPNKLVSTLLYYLLVWLIPVGLLLAGIIIWLKRRYL